jgi:hypothetical protein
VPQFNEPVSDLPPDELILAIREEFATWARARIDELRGDTTLEVIAQRVGMSGATLDNVRYGRESWPRRNTIKRIAEALGDHVDVWTSTWSEYDKRLKKAKKAPQGRSALSGGGELATRRTSSRRGLMTAGAVVTMAFATAVIVLVAASSDPSSSGESVGCRNQDFVIDNNATMDETRQIFMDCLSSSPSRRELRNLVDEFAEVDAIGDGPWPFYVKVNQLGLKVRTSGDANGQQIGTSPNTETLWVECRRRTDFTPDDVVENVGPRWLRVRWPNNQSNVIDPYISSASDPYTGYVYEAYAFPAGHNGRIPSCEE